MNINSDMYLSFYDKVNNNPVENFDNNYFLTENYLKKDASSFGTHFNTTTSDNILTKSGSFQGKMMYLSNQELNEEILFEDDILSHYQKRKYDYLCALMERNIKKESKFLIEEGAELPSPKSISYTQNIVYFLALHDIFPNNITTTIEGGLCLIFINRINRLFLEIYNDGEIGYIIENTKQNKLLENEELKSLNGIIKILQKFSY